MSSEHVPSEGLTRGRLLQRAGAVGAGGVLLSEPSLAAASARKGNVRRATDMLTWALPGTIRSLDFVHSYDSLTTAVLGQGLEGLLVFDDSGALKPRLAKSWSHPSPLTYIYKLRTDVKWWDGTPFTAADVEFCMGQHLDPKVGSQVATFYANVKSIKATGTHEITIKMKSPDAAFQYVPAGHAGLIVQKAFSQKQGKNIGTPSTLTMGTGPYKITKYTPDEGVSLVRNDAYWGPKPAIANLELKFITAQATRLLAMRSGQIDGAFEVPVDQADQWARISTIRLAFAPQLSVYFFSFDTEAEPWSDVHVRRAVAYATDKVGMLRTQFKGHGEVATSLVPPGQWGGVLAQAAVKRVYAGFPAYKFSIAKAKQELAASGFKDGFSATLVYPDSVPQLGKMCLILAQNLKQLNIKLTVKQVNADKWLNDLYAHENLGIQSITFVPDYPDPVNYPLVLLGSKHAVKNDLNIANYKNPVVDKLLAVQEQATRQSVRAKAIASMLKIAAVDEPYLPLVWPDVGVAVSKKFVYKGFNALYFNQPWATKIRPA
jgi:peptide/nickel transport system substrate-binding protein